MKNYLNWKVFFLLLSITIISIFCVLPYVFTVKAGTLQSLKVPLGIIVIAQLIQSLVLFSVFIFLGLIFTKKIGFTLPLIEALLGNKSLRKSLFSLIKISILVGTATGLSIYFVDNLFSWIGVGISTHALLAPAWQTVLAAFYGGIAEEIVMRLFLMSLFVWIGMKVVRKHQPSARVVVLSIILAAIIFGLGHLPITASITSITPLVIIRAIVLNGIGGIAFGWLFWKKGLESAMIAHFTADIVLLTVLPILVK